MLGGAEGVKVGLVVAEGVKVGLVVAEGVKVGVGGAAGEKGGGWVGEGVMNGVEVTAVEQKYGAVVGRKTVKRRPVAAANEGCCPNATGTQCTW